jgi:phosphatidylinositol dimannoside acyltransferase
VDLVTPTYRVASVLAQHLPRPVVEGIAPPLAGLWAWRATQRRQMVERHQRRVDPSLRGDALRERVAAVYRSYGRYYAESFRLPSVDADELDRRLDVVGYEHVEAALERGLGPILALPHLGSWEWAAYWLVRVKGFQVTTVVERLEPPALFEWFADFRRGMGLNIVPLGPDASRAVNRAIKARHMVPLLADRHIATGAGVEVELFGERTTMPAGPAALAARSGAALLPVGIYDRGDGMHQAVVRPPLDTSRQGSLRVDVARITQDLAHVFEELIRAAPEQWHLLQPLWPSDHEVLRIEPASETEVR